MGIYTTNSAEACQFNASDSRMNVIVVEDDKQLQKVYLFFLEYGGGSRKSF